MSIAFGVLTTTCNYSQIRISITKKKIEKNSIYGRDVIS